MKDFIIIEGLKESIHITGIINGKGVHVHVNVNKDGTTSIHYYDDELLDVVVRK